MESKIFVRAKAAAAAAAASTITQHNTDTYTQTARTVDAVMKAALLRKKRKNKCNVMWWTPLAHEAKTTKQSCTQTESVW